jgi:hypothetical protein
MHRHPLALPLLAASLLLSSPAPGQSAKKAAGPDSVTAAGCVKLARAEMNRIRKAYDAAGKSLNNDTVYSAFQKEFTAYVAKLTARFDVQTIDPGQLKDLETLYQYAQDDKGATAAIVRRADVGSTQDRADAILSLLQRNSWRAKKYVDKKYVLDAAMVDTIRGYLRRLDALGQPASWARASGRISVYHALRGTDSAAAVKSFPSEAMELIKEVPESTRRSNGYGIVSTYAAYIQVLKEKGDTAAAEALRLKGIAEFQESGQAGELIQMVLMDKPCPPLVATHWLNSPKDFQQLEPKGKVTLVMLTAHW